MKKTYFVISSVLIVFILSFILFNEYKNTKKVIYLYDYRITYSDKFQIRTNPNFKLIEKIINNMKCDSDESNKSDIRIGGFIIIEEYEDDIINSYRVQGTYVTKYTYKESYDNIISTSYYHLDEDYFQLLATLCDKLRKN